MDFQTEGENLGLSAEEVENIIWDINGKNLLKIILSVSYFSLFFDGFWKVN